MQESQSILQCQYAACGKPIERPKNMTAANYARRKFCCRKCRDAARREEAFAGFPPITCEHCGRSFTRAEVNAKPGTWSKRRFCGKECRSAEQVKVLAAANRKNAAERAVIRDADTKPCQADGCDQLVVRKPSMGRKDWQQRKYCSRTCHIRQRNFAYFAGIRSGEIPTPKPADPEPGYAKPGVKHLCSAEDMSRYIGTEDYKQFVAACRDSTKTTSKMIA